jgi:hypothetical protein
MDSDDKRWLVEELERLKADQSRAEPDIEKIFDQAIRWRFGTFISQAIAVTNIKARH